jgi:hypothetical protein
VVQWLGFHPSILIFEYMSKVEVRVRFTAVAIPMGYMYRYVLYMYAFFFWPSSLLGVFPMSFSSYHSFVGYQNSDSIKMLCLHRPSSLLLSPQALKQGQVSYPGYSVI